jgi:hypothetical protein
MPPTEALVIDPGNQTNVVGTLDDAQRTELEAEVDVAAGQSPLAETGSGVVLIVTGTVGILFLASGLLLLSHRRQRTYPPGTWPPA